MNIICCDLEGVFIPEIWINVALKTGIEDLKLTTRDISDYDVLMKKRLDIMAKNNLKLSDVTDVIGTMDPFDGAKEFVDWLKSNAPLIILSDTFEQFAGPLMKKLGMPTLLCHNLTINDDGSIKTYNIRIPDAKKQAVLAFKNLNYNVIAFGDSYNDVTMLKEADKGFLFKPPQNVIDEFPQFPVHTDYETLKKDISSALDGFNK